MRRLACRSQGRRILFPGDDRCVMIEAHDLLTGLSRQVTNLRIESSETFHKLSA